MQAAEIGGQASSQMGKNNLKDRRDSAFF